MSALAYLPDWTVLSQTVKDGENSVEATFDKAPDACIKCGVVGELYRHGVRPQAVRDAPLWGKPTLVTIQRKRYRCRACSQTFLQPIPDLDEKRSMTRRCVEYIQDQCIKRPFNQIAADLGVVPKTIRLVAYDYFAEREAERSITAPQYLGMDEVGVLGKPRCILTDVGGRRVLDMLEGRAGRQVHGWLHRLDGKERIEAVAIDMWRPYRDAVRARLPQAAIVVDKFHIVRMASLGLELVRKRLRETLPPKANRKLMRTRFMLLKRASSLNDKERLALDMWTRNVPILGEAYRLKEGFYALWDHKDKADAIEAYGAWRKSIPASLERPFGVVTTAMGNWSNEVFAFWDHPITNAYTEGKNRVVKTISGGGPAHSFEVVRAKVLFKARAPQTPPALATVERHLIAEASSRCEICGAAYGPKELHIAHAKPLTDAGKPGPTRRIVVCPPCNRFHTKAWLKAS